MAHLASQTAIEASPAAILHKSPSGLQRLAAGGGILYFVALFAGFALDAKGDPDPALAPLGDVARFMVEHPDRTLSRFLLALVLHAISAAGLTLLVCASPSGPCAATVTRPPSRLPPTTGRVRPVPKRRPTSRGRIFTAPTLA